MNIEILSAHELRVDGKIHPCTIGRNGFVRAADKREGDGKTPTGTYPLRRIFYQPDTLSLPTNVPLPTHAIAADDVWCDDPAHPAIYNRLLKQSELPPGASAEMLNEERPMYNAFVEIGYNDFPPVAGLGSAIFFHIWREPLAATAGCVAVSRESMLEILPLLTPASQIIIPENVI